MTERTVRLPGNFGYTDREIGFLRLASEGGYFLRRQYNCYIGRECGALGQAFIRRVMERAHAKCLTLGSGPTIYHLASASLYAAFGDEDNRNRRDHALQTIKRRIMALDFALECNDRTVALLGQDKIAAIRGKSHPQPDGPLLAQLARERWPLLRREGVLGLAFIDEGAATLSAFRTFLETYRGLFLTLDSVEVVYVAVSRHRFEAAERMVEQFTRRLEESRRDSGRLEAHFADRRLFENNDFSQFDQSRLDRFRAGQLQFSGSFFDEQYRQWLEKGVCDGIDAGGPRISFRSHQLQHNYDFFGSWEGRVRNVCHPEATQSYT